MYGFAFGGSGNDSIMSITETSDGDYILGGVYYSTNIDINSDRIDEIDVTNDKCNGLIVRLSNDLKYKSFENIVGNGYDEIYKAIETNDGGIVAVGDFNSSNLSTSYIKKFASSDTYFDGLIFKINEVVAEAEVQTAQKIEVENKLKEFKITTEIAENSEGQRIGGQTNGEAIEGEENKKYIETVKYGYSNKNAIEIIPDEHYQVVKILVAGEEIPYTADEQGKVIIPEDYFENITENKHLEITFERDVTSLVVHHYLIEEDENGVKTKTTTKVAKDETISGKVDDEYITNPKLNLADYDLEKDSNDEYVIPENASGKFSEQNEDVTYYYELRKYNLTVNHYLDGTENKLAESDITKHIKGYEYQTSKSNYVLQDYNFVYVEGVESGLLNEDTVVNYYYKKKEYNITTEIIQNSEIDVLGGSVSGEYNNTYKEEDGIRFVETVKKNETSKETIEVIPDLGYKVKTIVLESIDENENKTSKVIFGENKDENLEIQAVENEEGKITLTNFKDVTENKHIKVEFEILENSIIVHHYLKENNELTTKKVAEDEIIKVQVGQDYNISNKDNLPNLHLAKNSNGTDMLPNAVINDETGLIEISYYYEPNDITLILGHYLKDNNEKLLEDEKIVTTPNIIQDENGYYTLVEELSYKLEDNENYKNIINDHYLVCIDGNVQKNYEIGEEFVYTFTYNSDSEIKYLYKENGNYEFIINYYYDGEIDESKTENKTVCTGETIRDYTDNCITGYKLEKAKIINKNSEEVDLPYLVKDDLNKIILNVYYVKDTFNYKVKYFYNGIEDHSKEKNLFAEYKSVISNYPEENKDGYVLQYAKTINDNSEEIDLPLTITENESKNIINVYYSRIRTYKFYKTWSNIPDADVNNYRATFKLRKTVNGITSDYTDENGKTITKIIQGNGSNQFENVLDYDRTNKIDYSVEEIKVEKTIDNGNTWIELPLEDYKSVYSKAEILADKVKVGDYVNYDSTSGDGFGRSYTVDTSKSGRAGTAETFNSSDVTKWRVLNVKDGQIELIAEQPINQYLQLSGLQGYINAERILNEIGETFGHGNGATGGRSINVEDIEKNLKFDKTTYSNGNFTYGATYEYTNGEFIVEDQIVQAPQTMTQTAYYCYAPSYKYNINEDETKYNTYKMLFEDISTAPWNSGTYSPYWVASRNIELESNYRCAFNVQNISYSSLYSGNLYYSDGNYRNSEYKVLPVVTLEYGIGGEKDENGIWQIKGNEVIKNTLIKNYKIKKEWNLKDPNNYKATFKLMKTVDDEAEAVTDETGNIITKEIIGNSIATFSNLPPYKDEKEIKYSVVESKIEKTEDNWQTSEEVNIETFNVVHKKANEIDDLIINSLNNKFSLDINITEDTQNLPLDGINFTISIKDEENNEFIEENKTFTSGENGRLQEIITELPIDSENKTFTVTITQNNSKEGYNKIQTPVTFNVTSKIADDGVSYILVPESKEVTNTKGVEVEENYILVNLQNSYIAEYEVHYFYDGVENVDAKVKKETTVGAIVESYESKPQGMVLEKAKALNAEGIEANLPLTVRKDKTNNIINVYYRTQYKITTKVNKHSEKYTNKTETDVAGGTISGENQSSYENVFKGENSTKQIKITPNAGYEIASVKINGEEKLTELTEKINATDGSLTLALAGGTNIAGGYFTEMQEDKEVEVEFRKETKITVKYLEKETKAVLAEEKVINGLEGDTFGKTDEKHIIDRVAVNNYKETTVTAVKRQGGNINTEISGEIVDGVIKEAYAEIKQDENGKKYAKGTMFADEITLIYWYEKIPTGVWVRHVEIDEVSKVNGEKTELKPVEKLTFTKDSKEILREEFEGYVSVNCPNNMAPLVNGTPQEGNVVAKASEDSKTVTYTAGETVEVWFFYEKEHIITTEVVPHKETINGVQKDVLGGTISKNYKLDGNGNVTDEEEEFFENVLHRGNSSKKIEIVPQEGYRIKQILIGEEEQDLVSLVKEDGTVSFDAGAIKDIKKDISVKVEFEKIPAKVKVLYLEIVKEKDLSTGKEIEVEKEIANKDVKNVFINDKYKTEPKMVEFYKLIETKIPENQNGVVTKDEIIVKYYYEKLPFNLKVVKEISNIMLNNEKQEIKEVSKVKVEIKYRKINEIKLEISYRIRVTNTEKIAGKASLQEIVPNGFDLVQDANGKMWTKQTKLSDIAKILDGTEYTLETGEIKPGETKEYVVTLKWNPNTLNRGTKSNVAQLADIKNEANYKETTLNDNVSEAKVEIILNYQEENGKNNNNNEKENENNNNNGGENNSSSENNNESVNNNSGKEENNNIENNGVNNSEDEKNNNQENNETNNSSSKEQNTDVKETIKLPQTGQTRAIYVGLASIIVLSIVGIIVLSNIEKVYRKGKH